MSGADPAALPGIDMADALKRLGGNRALLEKVYVDFCRQYTNAAAEIGQLAASGAIQDAAALAHAVKGVAGNIGAKRIYEAARDLEAAYLVGGADAGLLTAFAEALSELGGAAPAAAAPSGAVSLDREKFAATATALRGLLQSRDLDAEDRFAELKALCPDSAPLRALGAAIDALDYRSALEHLAALEASVG